MLVGSFSSKTPTSLNAQLRFYVLEDSYFPALSLLESCSKTAKFPKNSLHSHISVIGEYAQIAFCFPSRRPSFAVRPSKYTFQVVSFRRERTVSLSRLANILKLISLCSLHPRTKELCWRLLDSRLFAVT